MDAQEKVFSIIQSDFKGSSPFSNIDLKSEIACGLPLVVTEHIWNCYLDHDESLLGET